MMNAIAGMQAAMDAHAEAIERLDRTVKTAGRVADCVLAITLAVIVPAVTWLAVEWIKLRGEL